MEVTDCTAAGGGNYDKFPVIAVPGSANVCSVGWESIAGRLREAGARRDVRRTVLVVECYPGVDEPEIWASSKEG